MLFLCLFFISAVSVSLAAEDTWTNAKLVDTVSQILELDMPQDADQLSDEELFEIQSNMLAEKGMNQFQGVDPNAFVTRGKVAELLYYALVGIDDSTVESKITYLAGLGYISEGPADELLGSEEIITALNTPALSNAIAEAYSFPASRPRRRTGVLSSPANPEPVTPPSNDAVSPV
jgi:hypothetical protein